MLYRLRQINSEQWFMLSAFLLSVLLSFLLGYTLFRYLQIDLCKSTMEVGTLQGNDWKSG